MANLALNRDPSRRASAAEGFDALRETIYESRFSISNGLLGLRAGRAVSRGERWTFRTELTSPVCSTYRIPSTPYLHLFPPLGGSSSALRFRGGPLVRHPAEAISHRTILDMRRGVLLTGCRLIDRPTIAVQVRTLHLLSLSERGIGVQVIELKIEEGEIEVAVEASFEGLGLGLKSERIEQDLGIWRTKYSATHRDGCCIVVANRRVRGYPNYALSVHVVGIGRRVRARSFVLRGWLLWPEATPWMRIPAASHGKGRRSRTGRLAQARPRARGRLVRSMALQRYRG